MKKSIFALVGFCTALMSINAFAHIGIARENVFALGDAPREYLEGSTAELGVQLPHDCSDEAGNHFPTTNVSVLFPNGIGTLEAGAFNKNAINSVKARVTATWRKVKVFKGPIEPYERRGNIINEEARAVHWIRGKVDNDHYDNLEIKASFPTFATESCASRLEVFIPAVQFCKKGHKIAWIGVEDSAVFQDDNRTRVTEDFAAKFTVVRDLEENPLPEGCEADLTLEAMPTTEEIDAYLPLKKHRKKSKKD